MNCDDLEKRPRGSLRECQLRDPAAALLTAEEISAGKVAGINFGGEVYALVADPYSQDAMQRLYAAKSRSPEAPVSIMGPLRLVTDLIDRDAISSEFLPIFVDAEKLTLLFGNTVFLNFPIRQEMWSMVPRPCLHVMGERANVQIISVEGCTAAGRLQRVLEDAVLRAGGKLPVLAITSMNSTGEDSILRLEQARDFCALNQVPVLVYTEKQDPTGSYAIVQITGNGLRVTRTGTGLRAFARKLNQLKVRTYPLAQQAGCVLVGLGQDDRANQ